MPTFAVLAALSSAPVAAIAGRVRPRAAAFAGAAFAALVAIALIIAAAGGGGVAVDRAWMPSIGARLTLAVDPLGAAHGALAAGIGALVLSYAAGYMPLHLAEEEKPARDQARFAVLLLAFMTAMVVLTTARDLIVMFVALDASALFSFLLIRFDDDEQARRSALTALVLTAGTSVVFLVGALLVSRETGVLDIEELASRRVPVSAAAAACLASGVLAKSALVPLHVWLPRAMVAPTPVSAYLHSAALVAAGVFVLERLHFLFAPTPALLDTLLVVGLVAIASGSILALVEDDLKRLLAWSTIAQYGYVTVLIAAGGDHGLAGAPLYVVVHAACKSALFMTAGALKLHGIDRLSQAGGLWRRMPALAASSGIATAGLAGLPLTAGFFKDEMFFAAAWERSTLVGIAACAAATLTLAYALRFWCGLFLGPPRTHAPSLGPLLVAPIAVLAAGVLACGLLPGVLEPLAAHAGAVVARRATPVHLAYRLELGRETASALAAWGLGSLVFVTRAAWAAPAEGAVAAVTRIAGPAAWMDRCAHAVGLVSDTLHRIEVRDLRDRVGAMFPTTAAFIALAIVLAPGDARWNTDPPALEDLPMVLALLTTAGAALVAVRPRTHLSMFLMLSFVGFGLALVFAFGAAPDVALVAVLVETSFTLLFVVVLARIPIDVREHALEHGSRARRRDLPLAAIAGLGAGVVAWTALSTKLAPSVALDHIRLAESAHAGDVVTAILADFRGLDTAVEVTVLAVATLGVVVVRWERREARS